MTTALNAPPELTNPERREWLYVVRERLGISCGAEEPTSAELKRAIQAANIAVGVQDKEDGF